ncbi:MAG: hypothetical protein WC807_12795 [Hyphomicrobium sp.]|jgi:hypothetical protein
MFDMVKTSACLFLTGKLFAEPAKAYTQLAFGILFTVLCYFAALRFGELPHVAASAIAGFLGGALQPYLFRNLRYR